MAVYKSPDGVICNLDKFVSFEVKGVSSQTAQDDGPLFKLEGKTETGSLVIIWSDKGAESEAKCNKELNEIYEKLRAPAISDVRIERRLLEICGALNHIGKFTEVQAKLLATEEEN